MPLFPKADIVAKTPEEVRLALSEFYGETVQFEGQTAPLAAPTRMVRCNGITGILYTFRGGDGGLYAIPLPESVALAFCDEVPMEDIAAGADFLKVMPLIFRDEGGFQDDPDDAGNYRPDGALVGTKYGISAATYPGIDIPNLTAVAAQNIYYHDWWLRYRFSCLPAPFNMKCFDIAINCGASTAIRLLQSALAAHKYPVAVDGVLGPQTVNACDAANEIILWPAFIAFIEDHYESIARANPKDQKYLKGWLARAAELMPS